MFKEPQFSKIKIHKSAIKKGRISAESRKEREVKCGQVDKRSAQAETRGSMPWKCKFSSTESGAAVHSTVKR